MNKKYEVAVNLPQDFTAEEQAQGRANIGAASASDLENAQDSWQSGFTPKGEATVSQIDALTTQRNGDQYIVTDSGTLNDGALSVSAGDTVAWDSENEVWYKVNQYVTNAEFEQYKDALDGTAKSDSVTKEYDPDPYSAIDEQDYCMHDGHFYQANVASGGVFDPDNFTKKQSFDTLMDEIDRQRKMIEALTDGRVNMERPYGAYPEEGDVLYLDAIGGKHFIVGNTLDVSEIDANWTAAGVVAYREGGNVMVMDHHDSGTITFTSGWMHAILGMVLSGTQTITFQQWNGSANAEVGTFSTNATTLDAFVEALDLWLRTTGNDPNGYNWHAEKIALEDGSEICAVVSDTMSVYQRSNPIVKASSPSGVTGNLYLWNLVDQNTNYQNILRENGGKGYRPGFNLDRLIEYFRTNNSTTTPTSMVSVSDGSEIMNLATYRDNQYCADLRAKYGEGETGWLKYIESLMMTWPTRDGDVWNMYGTGKSLTMRMAAFTYKNKSGTNVDTFRAAAWSAKTPTRNSLPASAGLAYGDWYMPDIVEMKKIFGRWNVAGTSPVQKALAKISPSATDVRSLAVARWAPARYYHTNAWLSNSSGFFTSNGFGSNAGAVAVALLKL